MPRMRLHARTCGDVLYWPSVPEWAAVSATGNMRRASVLDGGGASPILEPRGFRV